MKALLSLIRLHRWQLDAKRRVLNDLLRLQDDLRNRIERLGAEMASESDLAGAKPEYGITYADYVKAALGRRQTLEHSLVDLSRQIEVAQADIGEAFQEVKKYEMVAKERARRTAVAAARRDQNELDEVGLDRHRRRAPAPA